MTDVAARRNSRIAVGLAGLALLFSVVGVTPADAVHAVKRALTAGNADAVDGISASRSPRPGQLVPLGGDGRFSSAVLPLATRGPRGAQGPQGAQGPAGVALVRVAGGASTHLSQTAGVTTEIARLDSLSAGAWLLQWTATIDYAGNEVADVRCFLTVGGETIALADTTIGLASGGSRAQVLGSFDATRLEAASSPRLLCDVAPGTLGPVHVDDQRISAIRADSLG